MELCLLLKFCNCIPCKAMHSTHENRDALKTSAGTLLLCCLVHMSVFAFICVSSSRGMYLGLHQSCNPHPYMVRSHGADVTV